MPRLIHPQKAKVAILPHLTVLHTPSRERHIPSGGEFSFVRVVQGEGGGFAAEPVADVVSVAVDEGDADAVVEDMLEVAYKDRVDEVASVGEAFVDEAGGFGCVVDVYAEGLEGGCLVEVLDEVGGGCGVLVRVANIINASAGVGVVGALYKIAANSCGLGAGGLAVDGCSVALGTVCDIVGAAPGNRICKFHEIVDCVVYGLDPVGVVDGEFGVVRGLDGFVNNAVDDP